MAQKSTPPYAYLQGRVQTGPLSSSNGRQLQEQQKQDGCPSPTELPSGGIPA